MRKSGHNIFHYSLTIVWYLLKDLPQVVMWGAVGVGGYLIFQSHRSTVDIVLGLPLIFVGGGLVVSKLWSVALSIFSPSFNRGECVLCRRRGRERG